jgi:pyoverdine/dityrosine biosynthesis protein Dit1/AcrR family transcriptional regulator
MDPAPIRWEQTRSWRSRLKILEAALELFALQGFERTTFPQIARKAGVSVGLACRYFPTKEHFALALYDQLARALESWAPGLPAGTVAERFTAAMTRKLELIEPHRPVLSALAIKAIDPSARAAVLGPAAEVVRAKVSGVFALVVWGATDAPEPAVAAQWARLLYGIHLALIGVWLQDSSKGQALTRDALKLATEALTTFGPMLPLLSGSPMFARLDGLAEALLKTSVDASRTERARTVLKRIFARRRVFAGVPAEPTEAALALHLPKLEGFLKANEPVLLVLPAFPAKAPNPRKVLGAMPDTGEWLALQSLAGLLDEIAQAHPPGAQLVICSDGHVFADAVGVSDPTVQHYREELEAMIAELGTDRIKVFGLHDALGLRGAPARAALMEKYAMSIDAVRARAEQSPLHRAQVEGIHRFMFEDAVARDPSLTKSQAKKRTRDLAYEVVRRSEAWGALLSAVFPRAVRLSIHPQADVSEKIGIHLLPTEDEWLTPWHGAAVWSGERFTLMKRAEAEALGAVVVEEDGRPSYLEVAS